MSHKQRKFLAGKLPHPEAWTGRKAYTNQELLQGILKVLRSGCRWRDLNLPDYPDGTTHWRRLQFWRNEAMIYGEELSTVFSTLWEEFYFHRSEKEKDMFSEIINILESGKELAYYSQGVNPFFIISLQHIFKFYVKRDIVKGNVLEIEKK